MGCDEIQGWLVSPACPIDEFLAFWKGWVQRPLALVEQVRALGAADRASHRIHFRSSISTKVPSVASVLMVGLGVAVLAYLLGSLSFAVIVSKAMRLDDPRSYGSGNPGATNVLRSGNKVAAILTLLLDALKGVVAVLVARALARARCGFGDGAPSRWPAWPRSWAICTRCSSASRAARAWPPRPACCWR